MNSVLQILFACYCLNYAVKTSDIHIKNKPLISTYLKLEASAKRNCISKSDLSKFRELVSLVNPQFDNCNQQDAHEFFSAVIEGFSNELNKAAGNILIKSSRQLLIVDVREQSEYWWRHSKEKENSPITDLLQGQAVNVISCDGCLRYIYDFDNFTSLSLEIPDNTGHTTLEQCFEETMKINDFDIKSGFQCKHCNKECSIKKYQQIYRLPKILIIHLKRFKQVNKINKKDSTIIEFPLILKDINRFIHQSSNCSPNSYNLFAISHHSGSLSYGHYYSDILTTGDWKRCSDSFIWSCSEYRNPSASCYMICYKESSFKLPVA